MSLILNLSILVKKYEFNDNNLKDLYESGIYYDTLKTRYGSCDSIVELRLTVYPCFDMPEESAIVCENDTFEWRNKQYYKGKQCLLLSCSF